jgi:hypothetical protein
MPHSHFVPRSRPSQVTKHMRSHAGAAICALLTLTHGSAFAQPAKESVLMQVRSNRVASTTKCAVEPFVAVAPPSQPETGSTLCAVGGPFGAGMVGVGAPTVPQFAGGTIHLNRTFTFNAGDALSIRTVFNFADQIRAGTGGVNYFNGTWEITGGVGAFKNLRGQGTLTNAIASKSNVPPPPEFAREELVGWVTR